jgi:hypothetical protein
MSVPDWWAVLLLAGAAYRIWRLLAIDDITEKPRRWVLRLGDWQEGDDAPEGYRVKWGEFLECPWCAGFWISCLWYGAWQWEPKWTLAIAALFTINLGVGLIRGNLDPPEE